MRAISGRNAICRAISLPSPTLAPVINTVFSGVVLIEFLSRLKVQPGLAEGCAQPAGQIRQLGPAWPGPPERPVAFPAVAARFSCSTGTDDPLCQTYSGMSTPF